MKCSVWYLAAAALLLGEVGQAGAGSYSVSTAWSDGSFTVAGFDTSKGTLTGVSLELSGSTPFSLSAAGTTGQFQTDTIGLQATITATGPDGTESQALGTFNFPFGGGSAHVGGSLPLTGSSVGVPSSALASYEGPGLLSFTGGGKVGLSNSNPADFNVSDSGISLSGSVTVTYTYTPAATSAAPEPASLTMLGIGALGLLGHGWRRRPKGAARGKGRDC